MARLGELGRLLRQTGRDYLEDKAPRLAAALAYYALFALAPLLLVLIAVAGLAFGNDAARSAITGQARDLLGDQGGDFLDSMLDGAGTGRGGKAAAAFGTVALLV